MAKLDLSLRKKTIASKDNLVDAKLNKAYLRGAHLEEANLKRASLKKANLRKANLRGADLSEADLTEADLSEADLSNANLSQANLSEAQFFECNLDGVIFKNANMTNMKINRTSFCGADLTEAQNIPVNELNLAFINRDTKLPEYLSITWISESNFKIEAQKEE